ncbi:MAG: ATP--guanido phosphotransferase [Planctomycetia bacterium]
MELGELDRRGGEWLRGGGSQHEFVLSSRVRLARNLAGFPFAQRAPAEQRAEVVTRVQPVLQGLQVAPRTFWVDLEQSDKQVAALLVERHLISRELQGGKGPRGVYFGSDEVVSVMVNEEDHLRIQAITASLALEHCMEVARKVDEALEQRLPYAVSAQHGYLTACPTNAGTGLRASLMMHLPGLVQMGQMDRVFQSASRSGLTVRGFNGEGSPAMGDLYQISNHVTLGRSEEQIVADVNDMVPRIVAYEQRTRQELLTRGRTKLEDRTHRALALLRAARVMTTEEAMGHVSAVRLGVVLGLLPGLDLQRVSELFVLVQAAHVQNLEGRPLEAAERDERRAALLRARLA